MDNKSSKVIFVDMASNWKDSETIYSGGGEAVLGEEAGTAVGGSGASGTSGASHRTEEETYKQPVPEITGVTLGGGNTSPDKARLRTEKHVVPVPVTMPEKALVPEKAAVPEKAPVPEKEVDATSDIDGEANISSPEESEADVDAEADAEADAAHSKLPSETVNHKKDIDEWSISTDELMGMSPYYMILEKFLTSEQNDERETIASMLRSILDELKGLRADLKK